MNFSSRMFGDVEGITEYGNEEVFSKNEFAKVRQGVMLDQRSE